MPDDTHDVQTPLPSLRIRDLEAGRQRLLSFLESYDNNEPLTRERVIAMAPMVTELMLLPEGVVSNVVDSMLPYCGDFGAYDKRTLAYQLSGRAQSLKLHPLQPFYRPTHDQWVPLEVLATVPATWNGTKPGTDVKFLALAGQPAGHQLVRVFPTSYFRFLAYKVGFNRKYQYNDDPRWLIGFRFWLHLKRATDDNPRLEFDDWQMSPWMLKHNRAIIKLRCRFEVEDADDCPHGRTDECVDCPLGVKECHASTHR
jgi:hypothetical protein